MNNRSYLNGKLQTFILTAETIIPETQHRIRFADCDPFNHLNNSRYIDYFINAREDHLLQFYGFDMYKMARETGLSWVVAENRIAYLRPALLMEIVTIQSRMIHWKEKEVHVELLMLDESKKQPKALLWSTFTHFNLRTQKAEAHDEDLTKKFSQLVVKELELKTFDERLAEIKSMFNKKEPV